MGLAARAAEMGAGTRAGLEVGAATGAVAEASGLEPLALADRRGSAGALPLAFRVARRPRSGLTSRATAWSCCSAFSMAVARSATDRPLARARRFMMAHVSTSSRTLVRVASRACSVSVQGVLRAAVREPLSSPVARRRCNVACCTSLAFTLKEIPTGSLQAVRAHKVGFGSRYGLGTRGPTREALHYNPAEVI